MNYSRKFEQSVYEFCNRPRIVTTGLIDDYNNSSIFAYIKNIGNFSPCISGLQTTRDTVIKLLCDYTTEPQEVQKAESLIGSEGLINTRLVRKILDGKTYFVTKGMLFDQDKHLLMVTCHVEGAYPYDRTTCISINAFKDPENPVFRFILRKMVPYLVFKDKCFSFMNCDAFVLKPTYQGKLDHKLVGEFLADKINRELHGNSKPEEQSRNPESAGEVPSQGHASGEDHREWNTWSSM